MELTEDMMEHYRRTGKMPEADHADREFHGEKSQQVERMPDPQYGVAMVRTHTGDIRIAVNVGETVAIFHPSDALAFAEALKVLATSRL